MVCPNCGKPLPDGARFCGECGAQIRQEAAPEPKAAEAKAPAEDLGLQPVETKETELPAQQTPGETAVALVGGGKIPGPFSVIGSRIKGWFSSIGSSLKNPKKLIPVFVLAGVWIVLIILYCFGVSVLPVKIASFLTFAEGGLHGGWAGAVGGILGKTIFAGALMSFFSLFTRKEKGAKRSIGETFKGAFGFTNETLWAWLTGIGAAMLLYLFFSGGETKMSFMVGIAGAFLAARSALNNGFLRQLLSSFSSKGKTQAGPNAGGLVRGLSVGFILAALTGLSGIPLIQIIAGGVLFVGGIVLMILQAAGVVKIGKEAGAQ